MDKKKPTEKRIQLDKVKLDEKTQPRCEIDQALVEEYAETIESGATLPPIVVFFDGCHYWLADGYHRYHAATRLKKTYIMALVHQGDIRDAVLYAVGANYNHGKRRTNADKRKAVLTLLEDEQWAKWSDREISRRCLVDNAFVGKMRKSLLTVNSITPDTQINNPEPMPEPKPQERRFVHPKTGKETIMKTAKIGKTTPAPPRQPPPLTEGDFGKIDRQRERNIKRLHELIQEIEQIIPQVCIKKTVRSAMSSFIHAVRKFLAA